MRIQYLRNLRNVKAHLPSSKVTQILRMINKGRRGLPAVFHLGPFRATGITMYLENAGTLEKTQANRNS